jgi:cytoskeletal protein CcmA (bactofilin family)
MSIWKESTAPRAPDTQTKEPVRYETVPPPATAVTPVATPAIRPAAGASRKESLIASDITIEGKIEGGGSVRIAGKFKGDVNVQGDLAIEAGAKLTGAVRADKVMIAGELEGNVEQASHVDLLQTGVVVGDLKAGALAVAPGARMRGHADFGWGDESAVKPPRHSNGHGLERGTGS